MTTLSACLMTRGPAARVHALLEVLRPAVDELVVAVDSRAEPEVVAAASGLADRLLGYEYAEPVDRPLPWLHRQCSGRWLLTIDDDEVPGAELLAALPELARAEDVTHYWLPRRWLYPDDRSWLDEPPWRPDYQLRLVLNDLRLLRFPDETHWPLAVSGPGRYLRLPLYHADLVVNSLEARERKAERYERLAPGKRIAGRPLNEAYYLPERAQSPALAEVPQADLALVRRVLQAPAPEPREAPPLQVAAREEIDLHWEGRRLGDTAYRARLALLEDVRPLRAEERRTLDVEVENLGDAVWSWGAHAQPEIRLAYRWWRGGDVAAEGLRTPLPADLPPAGSELVPLTVEAPAEPGRYRLEIDLVHEHVRWFGASVEAEVEVRPRRLVAVHGAVPPEELAALAGDQEPLLLGRRAGWAGATASGAGAYLLEGLPTGRLPARVVLTARTARLLWNARRLRRGRRPRYAAAFLEPLAGADALLVVRNASRRREAWAERATVRAAKVLGIPVELR